MILARYIIPMVLVNVAFAKPVYSIDMDKEYTMVQRMMRLADLYRKFEKELPRKNYWEKFLQ